MSDLAKKIKFARTQAGLSQEQLASMLSTTQRSVSAWETSKYEPNHKILAEISKISGYPLSWFFEPIVEDGKESIYSIIARRIKQARFEVGLTIEDLALLLDVSIQTLSRWESGKHPISLDYLVDIAITTHKPIEWFIYDNFEVTGKSHSEDKEILKEIFETQKAILSRLIIIENKIGIDYSRSPNPNRNGEPE